MFNIWPLKLTILFDHIGNLTNLKNLTLGYDFVQFSYAVFPFLRNITTPNSLTILEFRIRGVFCTAEILAKDMAESWWNSTGTIICETPGITTILFSPKNSLRDKLVKRVPPFPILDI